MQKCCKFCTLAQCLTHSTIWSIYRYVTSKSLSTLKAPVSQIDKESGAAPVSERSCVWRQDGTYCQSCNMHQSYELYYDNNAKFPMKMPQVIANWISLNGDESNCFKSVAPPSPNHCSIHCLFFRELTAVVRIMMFNFAINLRFTCVPKAWRRGVVGRYRYMRD